MNTIVLQYANIIGFQDENIIVLYYENIIANADG